MLSISTRKNQSTEARGVLYIPTYEYNYKVITRCDKYYKNITSPIGANARIQEMYKYEQYKWHSRVYRRKTREMRKGAWKDRALDGLLEIHASAALL